MLSDRAQFLADLQCFADKIDEHSDKLLGYLQEGPKTIEQLVAHRPLYLLGFHLPCVGSAEHLSIGMHLDELLAQGQVVQGLDGLWSLR